MQTRAVAAGDDHVEDADPGAISRAIWGPERRALTIGLLLNVVAGAFEALAVATALPSVVRDLGGLDLYGWAFSAYLLASLVGIALAGTVADARGPSLPMVAGAASFVVGLAIAGAAGSMPVVVVGRAVQGLGSGAISAVGYAAIARAYPAFAHPRMLALLSSAWVVPGLVGPVIAGFVAEHAGWRWVFLGIAPLVAIGTALSTGPLHRLASGASDGGDAAPRETAAARILPPLALASGTGFLLQALASPGRPLAWLAAVVGVAIAIPALGRLVPDGTLRLRHGLPAAVALAGAIGFAFFGAEAFLPLALSAVRGRPATAVGLPLTAGTICWTVGSWIQAREVHRRGRRSLAASGVGLIGAGIALVAAILQPSTPVAFATAGWAIAGLGMGIAYSTTALVVLETQGADSGRASAALQLAWALGIALGTGMGGALVAAASARGATTATGIAAADAMAIAALVVAFAATSRLPR
ncbi:MAG: MFS transporter, partial [Alphaproteobacteria bacterium]